MAEGQQTNWSDATAHPVCPFCGCDWDLERRGHEWWCPQCACTWLAFSRQDLKMLRAAKINPD